MLTDLVTPESLEVQIGVAQQAFETLAEMSVHPMPGVMNLETDSELIFAASLRYMGECAGTVRLECCPKLAYAFTRRVISGAEPSSLDNDVKDAVGELVNTIGGNLKGLLPSGVKLNTPKVTAEKPRDPSADDCLSCLAFSSPAGPCRLMLFAAQ
jgi:CheY-specific phosphatase CheX